jgi:O-antigen ligase
MAAVGFRFEIARPTRTFFALILAFTVFNIVSLLVATSLSFGLRYFLITLYLLLIPLVFTHFTMVFGRRALDAIYTAFLLGTVFGGIMGTAALAGVAPGPTDLYFRSEHGLRLSPLFKDPNVYGPYMAAGGFLLLARAFIGSGGGKLASIGLAGFVLSMMFMTFSRGAWVNSAVIAFTFVVLAIVFTRSWRDVKWLIVFLGFCVVVVLAGLPFVLEATGMTDFFSSRAQLQYYDTERFSNWVTAYNVAIREPLGIGPGHFVRQGVFPQSQFNLDPHNLVLKVAVENGWLGLVSFFGALWVLMAGLFRSFRLGDDRRYLRMMIFAIIMGQLVNSLVVDSLHWRHLFVLLGFACGELVLLHRSRAAAR